ncbi:hypothetical protein D3C72_2593440 [compost metagenome]
MPASLEKRPRLTPFIIAAVTPPATPPAASCRPKALEMIVHSTFGTSEALAIST